MESVASLVITIGVQLSILELTDTRWIADTVTIFQSTLLCALFYDIFFRSIQLCDISPSQTGIKKPQPYRGGKGTGLCYAFLVPCAYILSQKYHMISRRNDPVIGHVTLAITVIPVLFQILLSAWFMQISSFSGNLKGLLLLSSLPWIGTVLFLTVDCSTWLGNNMAMVLYLSVTFICSIQWIIALKAPRSFTMPECTIITQGILLLAYQGFQPLFFSLIAYAKSGNRHAIENLLTNEVSEIDLFTLVAVTSAFIVLSVIALCAPFQNSVGFYTLTFLTMGIFSLPVLYVILKQNFITWMYGYIVARSQRLELFLLWAIICAICVTIVIMTVVLQQVGSSNANTKLLKDKQLRKDQATIGDTYINMLIKKASNIRNRKERNPKDPAYSTGSRKNTRTNGIKNTSVSTIYRKIFHLIAIVTFLPGIVFDRHLLSCAASCALVVFLFLETMRHLNVFPIGHILNRYLNIFRDKQDQGVFILTPIYLLVGLTLPLWLNQEHRDDMNQSIHLLSGVISLGIGDTMASVIGSQFGRYKWPGTSKSVEGTVAFVIGSVSFIHVLCYLEYIKMSFNIMIYIAIVLCSLLEAFTTQIDNLVLPLFMYCLLNIN